MLTVTPPQLFRWTRDDYQRLATTGIFDHRRVELIEGQILNMSPIGTPHSTAVSLVEFVLQRVFAIGHYVRVQMPFAVGDASLPQPDLAVVKGTPRDYRDQDPTDAEIIVEVAESSLVYDRTVKAPLYAQAQVPEYWIVNLLDRQLEVHSLPQPDTTPSGSFLYTQRKIYGEHDLLPNIGPHAITLPVADLLP